MLDCGNAFQYLRELLGCYKLSRRSHAELTRSYLERLQLLEVEQLVFDFVEAVDLEPVRGQIELRQCVKVEHPFEARGEIRLHDAVQLKVDAFNLRVAQRLKKHVNVLADTRSDQFYVLEVRQLLQHFVQKRIT